MEVLATVNYAIPVLTVPELRKNVIKNFTQFYTTGALVGAANNILIELEKIEAKIKNVKVLSMRKSLGSSLNNTTRREFTSVSTPEEMLEVLKNTSLISSSLLVSFVQMMTSTMSQDYIDKWTKIFEYQGFDALKFSQQVFMTLYWSENAVPEANQNEDWLKVNMDIEKVKKVLEVVVKLILLFFVRGTSIIKEPTKNMTEDGSNFVTRQKQVLNLQQKVTGNKDRVSKMVVTLPRICSAFPGQSLNILKVNGNNIQRPVTHNNLMLHGIPDYPKAWTTSVVFSVLPFPNANEMINFGRVLKTLLAYAFLESEIINQNEKRYTSKTLEQKWTLVDTYSRAAFNSPVTTMEEREHLFMKYCFPVPIPDDHTSLIIRGEMLYDKLAPFAIPTVSLAKTFSNAYTTTQNCYVNAMMDTWNSVDLAVWMDSLDIKNKEFHNKVHADLSSLTI